MATPFPTRQPARATWRRSLAFAALVALARPETWAVALAGFLARGGILAFLLPIVVLPTPSGIADVIAPALTSFAFGLVSPAFVALVGAAIVLMAGWVLLGGLAGAWADVELVREAAAADERGPAIWQLRHPVAGALAVRLLAHLPLAIALAWGAVEIVAAAYAELVTPFEVVTPLFVRVLGDVPGPIAVVVVTWALGEAAGGLAVRRLLLAGDSVTRAALDGWRDLARRPLSSLATIVVTDLAVGIAVVSSVLTAGVAWSWVRFAILGGEPAPIAAMAVVVLVALWLGGLVLAAALVAWRSVAWTAEAVRAMAGRSGSPGTDAERAIGTFGGAGHARTGGLSAPESSGTL